MRLTRTVPPASTRKPVGSGLLPVMARRSLIRSTAWTAVVGSLTAGDSADRDVGKLPEAERRILHERAFATYEEEPGDIALAQVPAVREGDGGAVCQVFAYPDGQLEPALLLPTQFGQAVQVGSRDDPGELGMAQTARRGTRQRRLGVNVGRRRREVLLDGSPALAGDRFEQVLDAHEPHYAMEVGDESEDRGHGQGQQG